ncbi:shadow of prion protein [Osmerus eperlanus]|uniref:shadow of prion protein n=1 Tax=Osmerus eperlanus TaxID=29151 RepID=UPI002E1217D8
MQVLMTGTMRVLATCWTFLLIASFITESVLAKGGRGGARGSARGTARGGTGGHYRSGSYGGTRSRFRAAGRSSPVRVAAAAAAGAAVALSADNWYASAFRNNKVDDSSEYEGDYYNRTNYFNAQTSKATHNEPSFTQILSVFITIILPKYGHIWESMD